ncbi:MAG: peptidase domain-containing ABC transporter [Prevotellaceae bacterium]|jgi:ATP-binding cassette subfamily B protein|nr:peptidase domain-containing ABC transporter [Prevotellaceae bacterium]
MSIPFTHQLDAMDCGPACLQMIAKYYGKNYRLEHLRDNCFLTREGVSLLGISEAAEKIGFRTTGVKITFEQLCEAPLPCIVHWKQRHFVVVYGVKCATRGKKGEAATRVQVADPAHGLIKYTREEFLNGWLASRSNGEDTGIALLLEPTPDFYAQDDEKSDRTKFSFILKYLRPYKKLIAQLFLGMLLGTLLQLIFPFLTQSIVDYGINNNNLSFVTLILIAQLTLFAAQTAVEFIRSWILLHISARINISIISDFLLKLMKLPIGFFDTKMIGDLMQRIGDHHRIQSFLTSTTLNTLFSFVSFVVFVGVLAFYNLSLLAVFLIASTLYVLWIVLFLKRRRNLDFKRFAQGAAEQSNLYQLITGMQEIKLNNCERQKRWEWERIQAKLFRISIKGLALSQYQQSGAFFINETKNIIISFFAAQAVITGNMTLGMMMAVQYIIGQLNAPISQFIGFIQSAQDAKISMERLGEIHNRHDEEEAGESKIQFLPDDKSFTIQNLSFHYEGPHSEAVLKDLNLHIPAGKTTAIVGMSGSGKTTLVKMLLGFYPPSGGEIAVGDANLQTLGKQLWRNACGAVMQDGFIFSDTIARNIAVGDERIDSARLAHALKVANLKDMIENLPLGVNTKIGQEGHGLSQGQKQRILLARVVYKDPVFVFLDEATNALDANNERMIMDNLTPFFAGKTVVVVAHRLSTVKNADQIVVLNKGKITETGTHAQLTTRRGEYYELVKNQLELGT